MVAFMVKGEESSYMVAFLTKNKVPQPYGNTRVNNFLFRDNEICSIMAHNACKHSFCSYQ